MMTSTSSSRWAVVDVMVVDCVKFGWIWGVLGKLSNDFMKSREKGIGGGDGRSKTLYEGFVAVC